MSSYEALQNEQIDVIQLLNYHIDWIIDTIHRRLTEKENYKNPWQLEVERNIHNQLFLPYYKSLKNFSTEHGRTIEVTRYKTKLAPLKEIKIVFHHFGSFVFHLSQASTKSKGEIKSLFVRKWKTGNETNIIVNESKPVTLVYKVKSHYLKMH